MVRLTESIWKLIPKTSDAYLNERSVIFNEEMFSSCKKSSNRRNIFHYYRSRCKLIVTCIVRMIFSYSAGMNIDGGRGACGSYRLTPV